MVGYIAKNKPKYHTVRTISKSNGKIGESIDAPNTQIHERLLSWHGAGASMKSDKAKLVLLDRTKPVVIIFINNTAVYHLLLYDNTFIALW